VLAVAERTDHPRGVKHRAVRSQQKLAFGSLKAGSVRLLAPRLRAMFLA
jgi:hypothetical protein